MNEPIDIVNLKRNERRSYLALLELSQKRSLLKRGLSIYLEEHLKDVFPAASGALFNVEGIKAASVNASVGELCTMNLELYVMPAKEDE